MLPYWAARKGRTYVSFITRRKSWIPADERVVTETGPEWDRVSRPLISAEDSGSVLPAPRERKNGCRGSVARLLAGSEK